MISFSPSEEQQMMINLVRKFAVDEMRKIYRQCDERGQIPSDIINTAWEMGFVSSCIPSEHGGLGEKSSAVTGALIAEELAWGDLSMTMHMLCPYLAVLPIVEMGTQEQKERFLPAFCDTAFRTGSAALLEPRVNFDPSALTTTATRNDGHYVLNGRKCFVPLAAQADPLLVYADDNGLTQAFFIGRGASGLEIGEREKNMGIKALATYEVSLNQCQVLAEDRLGGEKGADFNRLLNRSRVALAAMAVGVAKAAFEYSRDYAKTRIAFGEPIASRQAIAFMLAEMAIEIDATRFMNWEAAWKLDRNEDATKEASLTKTYADDMALNVTDRAVQILGGHGYVREHPVELWLRNARGFASFDGMAMV
jgi:acyl-CoA dehydrogenase